MTHWLNTTKAPRTLQVVVVTASALLAGCSRRNPDSDAGPPPIPVQAAMAETTTLRPILELVGTIVALPERTAMVSSQLGGWVERLAVVEGQSVKSGDLLVQLDSAAARTDIERAKAVVAEKTAALQRLRRGYLPNEIETARQDRDKAMAAVDGLRAELTALEVLLKRREFSEVQFETKAKALAAAEAALASAEAHLKLLEEGTPAELIDEAQSLLDVAQADLHRAQVSLDWCSITSPVDGVVVQLLARQGQYFDRASPLAKIVDLSQVFVQLRIPSRQFGKVQPRSQVEIVLESLPDDTFQGSVTRISGEADPLTGNVIVYALVENPDLLLRPGLGCQARISLPEVRDALSVPVRAIADHSGAPVVTVIRDGKAYETKVQIGIQTHELVQVLNGLAPGDIVATSGGYGLPDGCPVEVVAEAVHAKPASR